MFQFLYGLPDFYQDTIERQKVMPAYLKPLNDFNIEMNWYLSEQWNTDELSLSQFTDEISTESLQSFTGRNNQRINVILLTEDNTDQLSGILTKARQHQVLVSYLSPKEQSGLLGKEQFALANMTVPLWQSNLELPKQPIAGLMDIIPTVMDDRIACAGSFKNYTNGESLHSQKPRWPLIETYSPYIVIYDEAEITILDNSGQFNVYSSPEFTLKKALNHRFRF